MAGRAAAHGESVGRADKRDQRHSPEAAASGTVSAGFSAVLDFFDSFT